jgi:hypothetical protein
LTREREREKCNAERECNGEWDNVIDSAVMHQRARVTELEWERGRKRKYFYLNFLSYFLMSLQEKSVTFSILCSMRLCHPPDGSASPKYKLLYFKPP